MLKTKIWANFQRILDTQKIVSKLSKIWVWDPGSEIRDPGVKKAPDPGSGSATLHRYSDGSKRSTLVTPFLVSAVPLVDRAHVTSMSYSPLLGGFTIVLRYALRVKNELEGPRVGSALSFIGGVHIGARALHFLNFIWFG
jgi:hypothetical protein